MSPTVTKRLRLLASVLSVLVVGAAALGAWYYIKFHASLPQLDGQASLPGLSGPVTVTRDALGVPTLRGASRLDVARALGYLHAQDRFFQMDTLRRHAAGELAEILGPAALPVDKATRLYGFRPLARTVLARLAPQEHALLDAYATGVNAGLTALHAKPFEYYLLRTEPQPWRSEDSVLLIYAMTLELQDGSVRYERSLTALRDHLGSAAVAFFAPLVSTDDAALDGSTAPAAAMPGPQAIDLRTAGAVRPPAVALDDPPAFSPGSNSFALAGNRTASGAALLANDMHLTLRVPNTWYRASLEWGGHKVTGVTLPGAPSIVAGSNGRIAWGFTNACADTADLVTVQVSVYDHTKYSSYDGQQAPFEQRKEKILVKGGDPVELDTTWTEWGPIIGTDEKTRPLALHWVAQDPAAANYTLDDLEMAGDVDEAVAIAHRSGIPAQNFLVAGADGRIAWTIAGRLPKRFGYDGRFPVPWYFGDRGWRGLLAPDDVPVIRGDGQLWTANNRVAGGPALAALGDGGYDQPARAVQIRDDLAGLAKATPKDLLAIELDDRAVFLARWQKLLLATLTPEVIAQNKSRAELRALVEKWDGRASPDSVSYRLVASWRAMVSELVLTPIFAPCAESFDGFSWRRFHYEGALWTMVQEKPAHLLNPDFTTWNQLLVAAVDRTVAQLDRQGTTLPAATWGQLNTADIRHPLAGALPSWFSSWLKMPADPLPGDADMPRLQGRSHGASLRLVVSPGHEAEGIFEMPGGQSGHPLSPFFHAGHEAWVRGEATPFLPGQTEHTLELRP